MQYTRLIKSYENWGMHNGKPVCVDYDNDTEIQKLRDRIKELEKELGEDNTVKVDNAENTIADELTSLKNTILEKDREIAMLTAELSAKDNAESKYLRSDDEALYMIQLFKKYQDQYFADIPVAEEICKPLLWNIPSTLFRSIRTIDKENYPYILNPAILLYLFMTEDPAAAIGAYLLTLRQIMDDNAQAIQNDAEEYIADLMDEDEEDDCDVPDDEADFEEYPELDPDEVDVIVEDEDV